MADFGGFEIQTPAEVEAAQTAARQKAISSGDARVMRGQNIESALDTLFGNPQLNRARATETRIKQAQQLQQNDGESDIDYSLRRLTAMRDGVADVDPSAASQINTQLLRLGEMKFQRDILTSRSARETEEFNLKKPKMQAEGALARINGGAAYVINTNAALGTMDAKAFDLQDPSSAAEFGKAAQQKDSLVLTPAQAFELYKSNTEEAMRIRAALAKAKGADNGVGKNTWNDLEKQGKGLVGLYDTVDRLFNVFKENPDALSAASKGASKLDNVVSQITASSRLVNGNKTANGTGIDDWMRANNITNTRLQGLVVATAFGIAQAQNGTGRITDRDLQAAKDTIGSNNPNPVAIMANLNDILTAQTGATMDRISYLNSDGNAPAFVSAMGNLIESKKKKYDEQWTPYLKGSRASAAGGDATVDADGWHTLPSGVRIREKK